MSNALLKELLDGLDKIIEAFERVDLQGAANLQNEVYGKMAQAVDAGSLTQSQIDSFQKRNEQVWKAESEANAKWADKTYGPGQHVASDEADAANDAPADDTPEEDTEPEGANWESEVAPA